jgi:ribosomal 50S subunit-recycling heat shock protein
MRGFFMRIDKYLKVSRLIKGRTLANEACETGHVTINGKTAKPGTEVKNRRHNRRYASAAICKVRGNIDCRTCNKEGAKDMYVIGSMQIRPEEKYVRNPGRVYVKAPMGFFR